MPGSKAGWLSLSLTLRFRHDLQFIDSRGSLLILRVGRRSIPTCGRDMAARAEGRGATGVGSKACTVMPGCPWRSSAEEKREEEGSTGRISKAVCVVFFFFFGGVCDRADVKSGSSVVV